MNTSTIYIIALILIIIQFGYIIYYRKKSYKNSNEYQEYLQLKKDKTKNSMFVLDYKKESETLDLFIKLLYFKVQFYFSTQLAALYSKDKEITKSQLKKIKDDFYSDIMRSINKHMFTRLKIIFTEEGLILYIHQYFISELNKYEINKDSRIPKNDLNDNMKGVVYDVN